MGWGSSRAKGKSKLSRTGGGQSSEQPDPKRQKSSIKYYLRPPGSEGEAERPLGGAGAEEASGSGRGGEGLPTETPAVYALAAAPGRPHPTTGVAARHQLGSTMLQSLQRRFLSQQTLQTPFEQAAALDHAGSYAEATIMEEEEGEGGGRGGEDCDDGFILYSQPTYERGLSQRLPDSIGAGAGEGEEEVEAWDYEEEDGGGDGEAEDEAVEVGGGPAGGEVEDGGEEDDEAGPSSLEGITQTQFDEAAPSQRELPPGERENRGANGGGDPPATCCREGGAACGPSRSGGAGGGVGGGRGYRTTPEMASEERVQCNAGAEGGELFPIFRTKRDLKVLYIVRHGESEYNAASAAASSGWDDPQIYDAPLTAKGRQQAAALRRHFESHSLHGDVLWVTSPLTRAVETLLLACPTAHLLSGGDHTAGGAGGAAAGDGGPAPPRVVVRHEMAEKVTTTGDVGRPPGHLAAAFPQLAHQMGELPEVWWYGGGGSGSNNSGGKVNCALTRRFGSSEPKASLQRRIADFKRWLQSRPERVIVAVGHSSYWKHFSQGFCGASLERMYNCEVRTLHV